MSVQKDYKFHTRKSCVHGLDGFIDMYPKNPDGRLISIKWQGTLETHTPPWEKDKQAVLQMLDFTCSVGEIKCNLFGLIVYS